MKFRYLSVRFLNLLTLTVDHAEFDCLVKGLTPIRSRCSIPVPVATNIIRNELGRNKHTAVKFRNRAFRDRETVRLCSTVYTVPDLRIN